jgi:hypothetical protein
VRQVEAEGFAVLQTHQRSQVLVNYTVAGWEPEDIDSFQNTVQDVLTDILSWTGNGHCDGYTLGPEGLTFWCTVVERDLAISTLVARLDEERLLYDEQGTARLAVPEADRYTVVFPNENLGERLL